MTIVSRHHTVTPYHDQWRQPRSPGPPGRRDVGQVAFGLQLLRGSGARCAIEPANARSTFVSSLARAASWAARSPANAARRRARGARARSHQARDRSPVQSPRYNPAAARFLRTSIRPIAADRSSGASPAAGTTDGPSAGWWRTGRRSVQAASVRRCWCSLWCKASSSWSSRMMIRQAASRAVPWSTISRARAARRNW
jgi:hypothetical protein